MSWYLRETWWGLRQTQRHDHRSNPNTKEQVLLSGGRSWVRKPSSHREKPSIQLCKGQGKLYRWEKTEIALGTCSRECMGQCPGDKQEKSLQWR